ncbi:glycosyltransferase domain-containing protein [Thalassobellus sediminis]|uniref:glycosyltransferase domain-containing protein n=1 Tax=Thalassobellus sediminis TaxID=3367753 RepID=UPI003794B7E4
MKVITVINDVNDINFNLLRLSCMLNGLELVVLVSSSKVFNTRRIKDELLYDYLSDDSIDDNQIILFTDGTDALFTAGEVEIIEKFNSFDKKVIFSAETGCWPDSNLASQYPDNDNKTPYKYLNSGGFIGKAKLIKELLEDNDFDLENFPFSNQYLWAKRYLKHRDKIALDFNSEIFCAFFTDIGEKHLPNSENNDFSKFYINKKKWFNENFEFVDDRLKNNFTQTLPCHLHFNGTAKFLIDQDIHDMVYSKIKNYIPVQYYFEHEE